jgi:CheY-like chemotaxis protein
VAASDTILYVEDDPNDDFFLRRALEAADVRCRVQRVGDVVSAKCYLTGKPPYDDRERYPSPRLIITDLSVPVSGPSSIDLIQWLKTDPKLAGLRVLCSTGSDDPALHRAFAAVGITCYPKTTKLEELVTAIRTELGQ